MSDAGNPREGEKEEESAQRRWLPWVALAVVLLLALFLFVTFGDFSFKPKRTLTVTEVPQRRASVPDVIGLDQAEAERLLAGAGLKTEVVVSYDTLASPETVASQEPAGGSRLPVGGVVVVGVVEAAATVLSEDATEPAYTGQAKGITSRPGRTADMRTVPSLVGKGSVSAAAAVEAAGLTARFMYQPNLASLGKVYQQAPAPGSSVPAGGQVHMLVGVKP